METAEYRKDILKTINKDITKYECLLGVPNGHKNLINREVYFLSDTLYGPYLVVDVEGAHEAVMRERHLAADIECPANDTLTDKMVNKRGYLIIYEPIYRRRDE